MLERVRSVLCGHFMRRQSMAALRIALHGPEHRRRGDATHESAVAPTVSLWKHALNGPERAQGLLVDNTGIEGDRQVGLLGHGSALSVRGTKRPLLSKSASAGIAEPFCGRS